MFAAIRFHIRTTPVIRVGILQSSMGSLFVAVKTRRSTLGTGWKWALASLLGSVFVFMPGTAGAQSRAEWENYKAQCRAKGGSICDIYSTCGGVCTMPPPRTSPGNGGNSQGDSQAAEAAAAAQRQRDAEREQVRIEAENKRRLEELAKQVKFNQDKREALGQLKGISNGGDFDSDSGLKGVGSTNSGLKDAPNSGDSLGLKSLPDVNTDTHVVDARNVRSGLPKSVDDAISAEYSSAPSGVSDRVRKGFQAIMSRDWKVAKAWFEDALNHDPGNPDLKRLVDLADYTEKRSEQKAAPTSKVSDKPLTSEDIPADADRKTFAETSMKIHTHEAWMKFLFPHASSQTGQLQLPKDSDMEFLFDLKPAAPPNGGTR